MTVKAIETVYNSYRFRSRLEARWAIFFKTLKIEYRYEHEGFDLDGMRYLPDFWLPEWECWIEIKPTLPTKIEWEKAIRLCIAKQSTVLIISGEVGHEAKAWSLTYRQAKDLRKEIKDFGLLGHSEDIHWMSEDEVIITLERETGGYILRADLEREFFIVEGCFIGCTECREIYFHPSMVCPHDQRTTDYHPLIAAYTNARQARFEHGEKPV